MNKRNLVGIGLIIFIISFFVSFFDIFLDNIVLTIFRFVFFIGLGLIGLLILFRVFERIPYKYRIMIKERVKWVFLFFLLLVTISSLKFEFMKAVTEFLRSLQTGLTIATIFFGFLTFYLNREVIDKVEKEKQEEEREEQRRKNNFALAHPRMNSIPLLKHLLKWMYKEGWVYVFLLLIILGMFVSLRLSSFDDPWEFTGNYDKVRSEIPGAIKAYQNEDFFHEENNFYGTVDTYGPKNYNKFPFYQWLLYPFVGLADDISFFTSIKLVMLIIDLIILFSLYYFFKDLFRKKFALVALAYVSVNIYFLFYLATPVGDRFGLLFFILGAHLLMKKKYFSGYLLGGLSFLAKESFFLIVVPFYGIIELFEMKKDFKGTINRLIKNIPVFVAPYLLFQLFVKRLPLSSNLLRLIYICLTIISIIILHKLNKKSFSIFKQIDKKNIVVLSTLVLTFLGVAYFLLKKGQSLSSNFLTDKNIIFNWNMYEIVIRQMGDYFGSFIWIFLILGLIILSLKIEKNKYYLAVIISATLYLIIASKAIIFHQYYRHIFMIIFIILIIIVIKQTYFTFFKKIIPIMFLLLIFSMTCYGTFDITHNLYDKLNTKDHVKGLEDAGTYLKENLNQNEKILYQDYKVYLNTIFFSLHDPCRFNPNSVRKEIKNNGFKEVLLKYNCKYFISYKKSDFSNFLNYFEEMSISETPSRSEMIQYRTSKEIIDQYDYGITFDMRSDLTNTTIFVDKKEAMKKYNPSQYFELDKVIGDIYIYHLV